MKTYFNVVSTVATKYHEAVADVGYYEIDDMIEALEARRCHCEAERLRQKGFTIHTDLECADGSRDVLRYPLVVCPNGEYGLFATFSELRRLSDTVANLPIEEAFARWEQKIDTTHFSFGNLTHMMMEVEIAVLASG